MKRRELYIAGEGTHAIAGDTAEAADYMSKRLTTSWSVATLIGQTLKAGLSNEDDHQIVHLNALGNEVNSLHRRTSSHDEGVVVSTAGERMTLVAHVQPIEDNKVMNRGLVWVDATGERESTMFFVINPEHGLTPDELESHLDTVLERGNAFVEGLLEGQANPPYSPDFPVEATV